MPLLDARPGGLDSHFRPGNTFPVALTWPAGSLVGRTFTAVLDAATLALAVVGDVMTITASEAQTAAAAASGQFVLTETTGGMTQDLMVGTWVPSTRPGTPTSLALTVVTDGPLPVQVIFPAVPQAVGGGFVVGGDISITGEIRTGSFSATPPLFGATFEGIEREARLWPAGEMMSPTAQINFGNGFPRLNMAPAVTTDIYAIFEVEEWWLPHTIGVYFEWVNDHTTTGDVRWDADVKQVNIGTQTLAAATTLVSRTWTVPSDAANEATTSIVGSVANGNPISLASPGPGPLASFYRLRISRLGADAADTLAGPVGLVAASMTRGQ